MSDAPHNRWQDSANEQLARKFLDEASPIILADRILSAENHAELERIASRIGMSRSQLDFELQLLEQRGVIAVAVPPQPPTAVETGEIQFLDDTPSAPPLPAAETNAPPRTAASSKPPVPAGQPPNPPPRVTPVKVTPPPLVRVLPASPEDGVTAFLEKAVIVLAKHKSLDAQCQLLLLAEAKQCGLSPEEAWDAIGSLLHRPPAPSAPEQVTPQSASPVPLEPTRVEPTPVGPLPSDLPTSPVPVAPPVMAPTTTAQPIQPADAFQQYLRDTMGQLKAGIISEKIEKQLLRVGRKSHSLATVYTQHLIYQVAEELGIRVLSQEAAQTAAPETELAPQDQKLARFLEQVAPIIAEYRGINARSKILMSAVAAEEGLTEAELQAAVTSLQGQAAPRPRVDDAELQRQQRQASFDKHLREAFGELPNGVLTPKIRACLLEAGEFREGLPLETVENTITTIANEMQVLSVSEDNARDHLRGLIADSLADGSELPAASLPKLHAEGLQWGLPRDQVDSLIDAEIERNWQRQRKQARRTALLLGLSLTTAMTLLIAVLWVVIMRQSDRPQVVTPTLPETSPPPTQPTTRDDTSWWNSELKIAVADARVNQEDWRDELDLLRAADPQQRRQAYKGLFQAITENDAWDQDVWLRFAELCAACFALEPAPENAELLQDTLLNLVPANDAPVAESGVAYDRAFASIGLLTQMAKHAATPNVRAQTLTRALASHLAVNLDTTLADQEMRSLCSIAFIRKTYRDLTALTGTEANIAAKLHETLAQYASTYLAPDALLDLESDFLVSLLTNLPDGWRQFEAIIDRCIADGDSVVVLRLAKFYENTASRELQDYLGVRLLERAAPDQRNRDVAEVVREVNRAFGGVSPRRPNARWATLARRAPQIAAPPLADQTHMHRVLNQALARAHLNTLAIAASRGQAAAALFDAKIQDEPPRLVTPPNTPPLRRWPTKSPEGDVNAIRQLRATLRLVTESRFGKQRSDALENLAELTDEIRLISRPQATALAKYLIRPRDRNSDEQEAILKHIQQLGRWQRVQLALSEQLYTLKSPDNQIHEMLEVLAGELPQEDDVAKWQESWRVALLENVLDALTAEGDRPNQGKSFDTCRDKLTQIYQQQANLLKIQDEPVASAKEPATILRKMIATWGAELLSGASPQQAEFLQRLDHEMIVDAYLSENQLEEFVALQRTWLRLVQIYVAHESPDASDAADQIASALATRDRTAKNLFVQLCDGEDAILRTWLLLANGGEE